MNYSLSQGSNICLFVNYSRCQNSTRGVQPFGIICPYHMNLIFLMSMKEDLLAFNNYKTIYKKQILSYISNSKKLLPFPLKIHPEDENGEPCFLDGDGQMYTLVREWLNEINLTEPADRIEEIVCLICGLITDGRYMFSPSLGPQLGEYMTFLNDTINKEMLKSIWNNVKVRCIRGNNHFLYPMLKLPKIYQILLTYIEVSTVKITDPAIGITMLCFPPNIILDLDRKAFILINIDHPIYPIALNKENATFCTPLILAGERTIETGATLFNRGSFSTGTTFGQQRLMKVCRI